MSGDNSGDIMATWSAGTLVTGDNSVMVGVSLHGLLLVVGVSPLLLLGVMMFRWSIA